MILFSQLLAFAASFMLLALNNYVQFGQFIVRNLMKYSNTKT